jgi:anaerobic selenocysteine-containing dehydrogenase
MEGPRRARGVMAETYSPPLKVLGFLATRRGDPDRGPEVRLCAQDAAIRMMLDGELVRIEGPRRHETAVLRVDATVPPGSVVVRDVAGVAPSEIVRVRKIDTDQPRRFFA